MAVKFLYQGNQDFERTHQLVSTDEIRAFIDLSRKPKSSQALIAYAKNGLTALWFVIGLMFAFFGAIFFRFLTDALQNGTAQDKFPLLFFYLCPLSLLGIASYNLFWGVRTFLQSLDDFDVEQRENSYQALMQHGRLEGGRLREIEVLSPTTRRIHYTSLVRSRYGSVMRDATYITSSPVALDLSDTVVVLTSKYDRVLI